MKRDTQSKDDDVDCWQAWILDRLGGLVVSDRRYSDAYNLHMNLQIAYFKWLFDSLFYAGWTFENVFHSFNRSHHPEVALMS
ncbi:hypothetical protein Y032_0370g88 [Ancylostoma ceylanicum]|uniref:Uncharacterized protein n=1 Tax=Ancylostoma ceylanicum TaxID=53326 RepID=A0A016RVH6_9BILA|nr:hypothetical protein Y032_0370g88 [Ancylostoma ceylanicum]